MRLPVQVLVYPASRTGGEWQYLLLHRVPDRGSFWQGVTGGVMEGESLEAAANRELLEETGFDRPELEKVDYFYSFPIEDKWRHIYGYGREVKHITEHVFVAYVKAGEPRIDPKEHDSWRWCRFEEALELLTWPNNREALKRCQMIATACSQSLDRSGGNDGLI